MLRPRFYLLIALMIILFGCSETVLDGTQKGTQTVTGPPTETPTGELGSTQKGLCSKRGDTRWRFTLGESDELLSDPASTAGGVTLLVARKKSELGLFSVGPEGAIERIFPLGEALDKPWPADYQIDPADGKAPYGRCS